MIYKNSTRICRCIWLIEIKRFSCLHFDYTLTKSNGTTFYNKLFKKKKEETLQDMSSLYYSSKMKQNNFLQLQHIQLTFSIFNFCFHALKICRANICAVDSMYSKQTWFCHGSGRRNLWDERYYLWRTNYTSGWNCWPV